MRQLHTFGPVYDPSARILILGSFPSERSRKEGFYYGHPSNRFWAVLASILGRQKPETVVEKRMLLEEGIALWDVVKSCEITGSSDSSIKNVIVNDIGSLLGRSNIKTIFANGGTAFRLYRKYIQPITWMDIIRLPSTSPANAGYSLQRLIQAWSLIKTELEKNA